jgi:hypothetical protein
MPRRNSGKRRMNGGARGGNTFTTVRGRIIETQIVSDITAPAGNTTVTKVFTFADLTQGSVATTQQLYIRNVRVSYVCTGATVRPGGIGQVSIHNLSLGVGTATPSGPFRALSSEKPTTIACSLTGASQEIAVQAGSASTVLSVKLAAELICTYQILITARWELVRDTTLQVSAGTVL